MSNQLFDIVGVQSVQHSVEVGSVWPAVLYIHILEVFHKFFVAFELGEDVARTKLIIFGLIDELTLAQLQKLFLTFEDCTKKVSVGPFLWWDEELH